MSHEVFDRKVDGMICPQCEDEIAHRLLHTRGILSCTASYRKSTVTADFDPDILSAEDIGRILAATGYPVGDGRSGRRRLRCALCHRPAHGRALHRHVRRHPARAGQCAAL